MAVIDYAALTAPVSDAEPCGPDLDLTGDPDFMNFMAKAEGLLPSSYFSSRDGKPFDRGSIDFAAEFAAAKPFLEQTRDLRLLTTLAKFHVLDRDLVGFEACIRTIGSLLNERWDDVHPRSEDGDLTIRMAALETLDDSPTVVLPLQFIPLINSRRFGIITYRSYMIATGEAKPLDEEEPIDVATIDKSLMEAELEPLVETLRQFDSLQAGLNNIHAIWIDHAGFEQAVNLQKAPQLVGKIVALLNGVVTKRDPTLARAMSESAPTEGATSATQSAIPAGSVTSPADAADALAAVAQYFSRSEPSNPALLLVRQAEELIGKSFVEVMRILVPAHVEQAALVGVRLRGRREFESPVDGCNQRRAVHVQ